MAGGSASLPMPPLTARFLHMPARVQTAALASLLRRGDFRAAVALMGNVIPRAEGETEAVAALAGLGGGGGGSGRSGRSGEGTRSPWEAVRLRVAAFQQRHGCLPRKNSDRRRTRPLQDDEDQLGAWCHRQRMIARGCPSLLGQSLTPQQKAALEAIPGWWWEVDREADWWHRWCEVAAFASRHHHLPRKLSGQMQARLEPLKA